MPKKCDNWYCHSGVSEDSILGCDGAIGSVVWGFSCVHLSIQAVLDCFNLKVKVPWSFYYCAPNDIALHPRRTGCLWFQAVIDPTNTVRYASVKEKAKLRYVLCNTYSTDALQREVTDCSYLLHFKFGVARRSRIRWTSGTTARPWRLQITAATDHDIWHASLWQVCIYEFRKGEQIQCHITLRHIFKICMYRIFRL